MLWVVDLNRSYNGRYSTYTCIIGNSTYSISGWLFLAFLVNISALESIVTGHADETDISVVHAVLFQL